MPTKPKTVWVTDYYDTDGRWLSRDFETPRWGEFIERPSSSGRVVGRVSKINMFSMDGRFGVVSVFIERVTTTVPVDY